MELIVLMWSLKLKTAMGRTGSCSKTEMDVIEHFEEKGFHEFLK